MESQRRWRYRLGQQICVAEENLWAEWRCMLRQLVQPPCGQQARIGREPAADPVCVLEACCCVNNGDSLTICPTCQHVVVHQEIDIAQNWWKGTCDKQKYSSAVRRYGASMRPRALKCSCVASGCIEPACAALVGSA